MPFSANDNLSGGSTGGAVTGTVSISGPVKANQGDASSTAWPFFTSQVVSVAQSSAWSAVVSVSGPVSGSVNISGAVSGVFSVSGAVIANQGTASSVAWPFFTSQVVSVAQSTSPWAVTGIISVSGAVSGVMSVSGSVSGVMSISGAVSGVQSISGLVSITGTVSISGSVGGVNQGVASAVGWPMFIGGASAASGYQMFTSNALSNTVQNVKTASGNVYGYHIQSRNTSDSYVQMFKVTAASVTLSSTVAVRTLWIPASGGVDGQCGPLAFASGIAVAATASPSGSTACSVALIANVDYF